MGLLDGLDRLGERADLVQLDQDAVAAVLANRPPQEGDVGHQQIVADQLYPLTEPLRQQTPPVPVFLSQPVFDAHDGVLVDPVLPEIDHLRAGQASPFAFEVIEAIMVERAGCRVEGEETVSARLVSGFFDGGKDDLDGRRVRRQRRRKAAFVADVGGGVPVVKHRPERGVDLGSAADRFTKGRHAGRHDHELLDVRGILRVFAAVQDVEHRHRQNMGIDAAQVAIEGHAKRRRRRAGAGQRDTQDGIGAELALVRRAVQRNQRKVDPALVARIDALQRPADFRVHVLDGLEHTLAAEALLVAIAQLDGLVDPCGGARRNHGLADGAISQRDLHRDRRAPARVQHLTAFDPCDSQIHLNLRRIRSNVLRLRDDRSARDTCRHFSQAG